MVVLNDSISVGTPNTVLDSRSRVKTLRDILKIKNPAIGALVYCEEDGAFYVITELADKIYPNGVVGKNVIAKSYKKLETDSTIKNIYIGDNGNWFINDIDQGVAATGPQGKEGPVGPKNILSIGNVTVGNSTDDYNVILTDNANGQTLNIKLPQGPQGVPGKPGDTGLQGPPNTITAGVFQASSNPDDWKVELLPVEGGQQLNMTVPRGEKGERGEKNNITIGSVTVGNDSTDYEVSLADDQNNAGQLLNIKLPSAAGLQIQAVGATLEDRALYDTEPVGFCFLDSSTNMVYFRKSDAHSDWTEGAALRGAPGEKGDTGDIVTVQATAQAGDDANVVVDTSVEGVALLHFTLPRGKKGNTGDPGPAVKLQVDAVEGPEVSANVEETEDGINHVHFYIPRGPQGIPGEPGSAPTLQVKDVKTALPHEPAQVVLENSPEYPNTYSFTFTIPQGVEGAAGFNELAVNEVQPTINPFNASFKLSAQQSTVKGYPYQLVDVTLPCGPPVELEEEINIQIVSADQPATGLIKTTQQPYLNNTFEGWQDAWKTKQKIELSIPKNVLVIVKQIEPPSNPEEGMIWIQP